MEDTASEALQPGELPARTLATMCAEVPGHCAPRANSSIPERTNINWALRAHAALCAAYSEPFQSALTRQAFRDAHLVFSHHCRAKLRCALCGLTFELSGRRRQDGFGPE